MTQVRDFPGAGGALGRFVEPDRLMGWVKTADGCSQSPRVRVMFKGVQIGEATVLPQSGAADLASKDKLRFNVRLARGLSHEEVYSEDLLLLADYGTRQVALKKPGPSLPSPGHSAPLVRQEKQGQRRSPQESELSQVWVEVGTRSPDEVAIVGRQGFLFLAGGTNNVGALYRSGDRGLSDRWLRLLESRAERLQKAGVDYLQVFLPEKSSALPHLFPIPIEAPSPAYKGIREKVRQTPSLKSTSLFFEDLLGPAMPPEQAFRKVDSHLTSKGARTLFDALLHRLSGKRLQYEVFGERKILDTWDLGSKFSSPALFEAAEVFEGARLEGNVLQSSLETIFEPATGHTDTYKKFLNPDAPVKKRVLIFGNSFFWGGGSSLGQCWWFSRFFSEVHFIWNPRIKYDIVEKVKPDAVVCQTIERFLGRVPDA